MTQLSILIPARNEQFLAHTIADILEHREADTEIIAVLDGAWAEPPIPDHERVTLIYHSEPIGQRAATNEAARIARGQYLMKVDAHCSFDQGFDRKMIEAMEPDITMVPVMRNLWAFDWVCASGHRRYQGPSGPCAICGQPTEMDIVWISKKSPQSTAYRFDRSLHFQYWGEYKSRQHGDLVETMSLQGSCFMLTREKYFELNICDESWGSWGNQGTEVACKTWLSGGRVLVNKRTWYSHLFRTQGGDFGFPYPNPGAEVERARECSRDLFLNDKWDKAIHPLSWLIDKFSPVPDWHTTAGIVYYTDNRLDPGIMAACQNQLQQAANGKQIVSVSLQPLDFGENIVLNLERGYLAMFRQILAGLEALDTDIVYLCEHDVLYHPSHFDFVPPDREKVYYNLNFWKVDSQTGHALHYDAKQTSGLCAYRDVLIRHYRERVRRVEREGFSRKMGFEPGSHHRAERVDDLQSETWRSAGPNLDIRHSSNLTPSRWRQDQFRDRRNCRNWQEADCVPGWYEAGEFVIKLLHSPESVVTL